MSVQLSINDLSGAIKDLGYFYQVLGEESLRYEFDTADDVPPGITSLLYHASAAVSVWTFECLVRRGVKEDVVVGDRRRITAGGPLFLEVYVTKNATEDQRNRIQSDYMRALQVLEEEENPLGLGDIVGLIKARNEDI